MSNGETSQRYRLTSIDFLRGCAALGVVITHAFPHEMTYLLDQARWFRYLGIGIARLTLGVPLFFVISGFCIHLRWAKRNSRTGEEQLDFIPFWKRRLHRLYPPYFIALCICMGLVMVAYFLGRARYYPEPKLRWIGIDFIAHVTMLHGFHRLLDLGGGNPAMWTLAREEYFYLAYLPLLAFRRRFKLLRTVVTVLAFGLVLRLIVRNLITVERSDWLVETSATVLWIQWVLGMVAVEAYYGLIKLPKWCRSLWLVPVWFAAGELSRVVSFYALTPLLYGMTFFTLVNYCVTAEQTNSLQNKKIVMWLAKVGGFSYSLYLIHYPVVMVLREMFGFIAAPANVWIALLGMAIKIVVCFYAAKLFFRLVERQFLNSSISLRSVESRSSQHSKVDTQLLPEPEKALQAGQ